MPFSLQSIYHKACRRLHVHPCVLFESQLTKDTVCVKLASLKSADVRAMMSPLCMVSYLVYLDLSDNCIGDEGIIYLKDLLIDSPNLETVKLRNNNLKKLSARVFKQVISTNPPIQYLDLSGNKFGDSEAEYFSRALLSNYRLKVLVLSHNEFSVRGGEMLQQALVSNDSLEILDLSWNHIRLTGAVELANSVKDNKGLLRLDLSMNGFGNDGALAMGKSLKDNITLLELNLSYNRISVEGIASLCRGLQFNNTLQVLKLARNPLTTAGAFHLITTIRQNISSELSHLDLSDIPVTYEFDRLVIELVHDRPNFTVLHGGYVRSEDSYALRFIQPLHADPFKLLIAYLKQKGYRPLEFFSQFDVNKDWTISRKQFIAGLNKVGLPLTAIQLENLVNHLDKNRNGVVNFREFMRYYRDQERKIRELKKTEKSASSIQFLPSVDTTGTTQPIKYGTSISKRTPAMLSTSKSHSSTKRRDDMSAKVQYQTAHQLLLTDN